LSFDIGPDPELSESCLQDPRGLAGRQAEAALRHYDYYLSSELKTLEDPVETGPPRETKALWTAGHA